MKGKAVQKQEFAVNILLEYAKQNGINGRDITDLSPLESWLILRLHNIEGQLTIPNDSYSMTGDDMNSLEFFDMIKKEWCVSKEQYKPFWNDILTFARKYHKERKEYCRQHKIK